MFCDIKDRLSDPVVRQILSCCLFDASSAGIDKALTKYVGEQFYGWIENGEPLGVCGFRVLQNTVEICHIAVAENARNKGIGRAMVSTLQNKYGMDIQAETDDGAVNFYRKCGFEVTAMYKQYDGKDFRRWTCVLKKMRTEQQIMDLLLNVAQADERIRAVLLAGSRVNPNAPKDIYMDFDVAYMVTDVASFTKNHNWIDIFGERLILQMPEAMRGAKGDGHFNYQMIFTDGNRIDLSLVPISEETLKQYNSLTLTLLDKDGIVPDYPPPTDKDYWLKEPDSLDYYSCCNNFWWCLNNVAKGIARDELAYVMSMINDVIRSELHDMINWYIGTLHGFDFSTGKNGKYFKRWLPPDIYKKYTATYSGSAYKDIWASIFVMCDLFHALALPVAAVFGFTYRQDEEDGIRKYMKMVKG